VVRPLDILVNNAGVNPVYGFMMDADLDGVRKVFDINVVAALGYCRRRTSLDARPRRRGGEPRLHRRAALHRGDRRLRCAKAALIRLTEELAWQLGPGSG